MKPVLIDADFEEAAKKLGCAVSAVKAVCEVEAPRGGFYEDGKPVILFEGHKFSKFTKGVYDKTHPTISYPNWTRTHYLKGEREYERLELARSLNVTAADMSASWGRFQIMGFNFALCGFVSVADFVAAMQIGEREQLLAFIAYVQHTKLDDELRDKRWPAFAEKYNGPEWRKNDYAGKLSRADAKYGRNL